MVGIYHEKDTLCRTLDPKWGGGGICPRVCLYPDLDSMCIYIILHGAEDVHICCHMWFYECTVYVKHAEGSVVLA